MRFSTHGVLGEKVPLRRALPCCVQLGGFMLGRPIKAHLFGLPKVIFVLFDDSSRGLHIEASAPSGDICATDQYNNLLCYKM